MFLSGNMLFQVRTQFLMRSTFPERKNAGTVGRSKATAGNMKFIANITLFVLRRPQSNLALADVAGILLKVMQVVKVGSWI